MKASRLARPCHWNTLAPACDRKGYAGHFSGVLRYQERKECEQKAKQARAAPPQHGEVGGQTDRGKKQQQEWCLRGRVEGNAQLGRPLGQQCQDRKNQAADDRGGDTVTGQQRHLLSQQLSSPKPRRENQAAVRLHLDPLVKRFTGTRMPGTAWEFNLRLQRMLHEFQAVANLFRRIQIVLAEMPGSDLAFIAGKTDWIATTIPLMKDITSRAPAAICEVTPGGISRNLLINRDRPPFNDPECGGRWR